MTSIIKSIIPASICSAFAGLAAAPISNYVRKLATESLTDTWVCISHTLESTPCFPYKAGKVLFCADRIDILHTPGVKKTLEELGSAINGVSGAYLTSKIPELKNSQLLLLSCSAGEEIFLRGVFQNVLLRAAPAKIAEKCFPKYAPLVDHPLAKMGRIALSATLFAIMHTNKWDCAAGGTLPQLLTGTMYATIAEQSSLLNAIIAHCAFNSIQSLLNSYGFLS